MKKIKILLAISLLAISFMSCEQDENVTLTSYRIKQIIKYKDDLVSTKSTFTYENENLLSYSAFRYKENNWDEFIRNEYTTNGELITKLMGLEYDGIWLYNYKTEYIFQNGLEIGNTIFKNNDGIWQKLFEYTYQYSGSNLITWHRNEHGTESTIDTKGEYTYNDNKLSEYIKYELRDDNWYPILKETFLFTGNKLTEIISSEYTNNDTWQYVNKYNYAYAADRISEIKDSNWEFGIWILNKTVSYNYDKNDCLSEEIEDSGIKRLYEYEEGTGNAKSLWFYPEYGVYKKPTIKSTYAKNDFLSIHNRIINKLINR